jgi:hypothetical protein
MMICRCLTTDYPIDERYLQANESLKHLHWSKRFCGALIISKTIHNLEMHLQDLYVVSNSVY